MVAKEILQEENHRLHGDVVRLQSEVYRLQTALGNLLFVAAQRDLKNDVKIIQVLKAKNNRMRAAIENILSANEKALTTLSEDLE